MMPPPQQLPTELFDPEVFKQPIHLPMPPMELELPLPGGGTRKMTLSKPDSDPKADFATIISHYEADTSAHASYDDRLDYATALVFSGRSGEAIPVFQKLEADFPGKYATASNLGTAYELAGDVPNALKWIGEGIARNPDSHAGTEWLHLAILETKLKLKADKNWLAQHSVLDGQRERGALAIEHALEYQLNERMYFIKEKDPIMCDLFYEAAAVTQNTNKRAYFVRQAPKFGSIRNAKLYALTGVKPR